MVADAEERLDIFRRGRIHQYSWPRSAPDPEVSAEACIRCHWFGARGTVTVPCEERFDLGFAAHFIRPGQPDKVTLRRVGPMICSATVSASIGRRSPSRSGHSTSTIPSDASSQATSDKAAELYSRQRS